MHLRTAARCRRMGEDYGIPFVGPKGLRDSFSVFREVHTVYFASGSPRINRAESRHVSASVRAIVV